MYACRQVGRQVGGKQPSLSLSLSGLLHLHRLSRAFKEHREAHLHNPRRPLTSGVEGFSGLAALSAADFSPALGPLGLRDCGF